MAGKTYFQKSWLHEFQWVAATPDGRGKPIGLNKRRLDSAFCIWCKKTINLSNMGRSALVSHAKRPKHMANVPKSGQEKISAFCPRVSAPTGAPSAPAVPPASAGPSAAPVEVVSVSDVPMASSDPNDSALNQRRATLDRFVTPDEVTRAECVWLLYMLENHYSFNSNGKFTAILKKMFPSYAHEFISKLHLGPNKLSYVTTFGLAPYFKSLLLKDAKRGLFVACFDEAFNKIAQKCQMDIVIRFWNDNEVNTRYYNSMFLGHSRATDLLEMFRSGLDGLDLENILQISMDGPNVNWKFLEEFKKDVRVDDSSPKLLEIGSCGLHVCHGALQTAFQKTDWNIGGFLRGIFKIFDKSPARKDDFTQITGSTVFPRPFCGHRWLENVRVVERALEILPKIRQYVKDVKPKPVIQSFKIVSEAMSDPFLEAKLGYFKSLSLELEPFLHKFQSPKPMAPFLFDALTLMIERLAKRFVKPSVLLKTSKQLMEALDNESNFRSAKDVDIGMSARFKLPPKSHGPSQSELKFYIDCRAILMALCSKLKERCPLKYKLVEHISCLVPGRMASDTPNISRDRFQRCATALFKANRISDTIAERAVRQYNAISDSPTILSRLKEFDHSTGRLDNLYFELFSSSEEFVDLWKCIQILLLLSHGQASVESGFSVNKDMLVENLKERSLVAHRMVYDSLKSAGGAEHVTVDKQLLLKCRSAHSAYTDFLDKQKKEDAREKIAKKRASEELKESKAKQRKIEDEKQRLEEELQFERKKTASLVSKLKKK